MRTGLEVPRVGQVVISTAGRDTGAPYLVVRILDERFVAIANGRSRSLENPKRKNLRHLKLTPVVYEELGHRLQRGDRVTDAEIQEALAAAVARLEGGAERSAEG